MSKNGLHTFAFHTKDETSDRVANILRTERPSLAAFATTKAVGLRNLDPETAARQYLNQALASKELPQFTAPEVNNATCEFKILGTETLPLTETKTVKFRQTYNKIPVYGSLITIEMDYGNELLAVNSSLGEPINVDTIAQISPAEALNKVRDLAGYGLKPLEATPRLCYYFDTAVDRWRLIYVIEDVRQQSREKTQTDKHIPLLMDYLIDAHNGEIVAKLPRTPSVAVLDRASPSQQQVEEALDGLEKLRKISCLMTGDRKTLQDLDLNVHTYDFEFRDLNSGLLPGNYVGKPPEWAPGAISAHANAAVVAIFLRDVLRRNGIDNIGGPLISSINCIVANESPDGQEWRNAAWVEGQMVYGQRKVRGQLRSYAVGLDVVAHEIFHGVTDRTARLQYAGESGALNESYSDIFGIIVSNFEEPNLSAWNWEMGEELQGTGIPLRDLSNPSKYRQPAHMRDYLNLPITEAGDWGGVHFNSGIHNLAAYKIMTAKDRQGAYLFDRKSLAALFYLTLTQYLSRTSLFRDSRRAIELVGRTLFRGDAIEVRNAKLQAIARAFDAVGISISGQEQLLDGSVFSGDTITRSQQLGNGSPRIVGNHYLVYVHGISQHREHYSDSWWQALQPHVGEVFKNGNLGDTRLEVLWSHLVNTETFINAVNAVDNIKQQQLRREIMAILEDRRRQELVTNTNGGFHRTSAMQTHWVESNAAALAIDDFLIYMLNSRMRQRIIDCFTDVVKPLLINNNQIDIISHSWGTVVAYEGLRELEANEQFLQRYVSNFFTVGSALSIGTVRDFLRPENRDGRRPSMVNKWINLDAKGDLVGGTLWGMFDISEETLKLNPTSCSQQWFGYDSVCAHNSYFVKENIAVNQEIFAKNILA
ncbi:M4 family metallopeptidase [Nostoc sp. NZL]|uniref:M4 family metallopeptidase n=1 Tax=Nostoc sp. NZL TaxID=2650612 RepID=UPI0018C4B135|nr:M4 family metallopeptidase [Nostoc sp. NZL]MBG1243932.1 M4 family metallopeptidase [Nostoc sp. NZL]